MNAENIKAKVNFHFEGDNRPFLSTQDYETLKKQLWITNESGNETSIKEIKIDEEYYEIINTEVSIYKQTSSSHITYGIDLALDGEKLNYNFKISLFLRKK